MKPSKKVKGIIYRLYDSKSSDKVIHILCEDGSKYTTLAKGVRKEGSRKSHSIDLGNYIEAKVIEDYNISILTEIKLVDEFLHWKSSFDRLIFLQLFCEIISNFAYEENHDARLFKIFQNILGLNSQRVTYLAAIFALQILSISGNLPKLGESILTSDTISENKFYALPNEVGYISEDDSNSIYQTGKKIPDRIYKTQKFILKSGIFNALRVNLTSEEEKEMLKIHLSWIETVIERALKSKVMVREVIG